jgi:hypothetical protein
MWYLRERGEIHAGFWWASLKERDYFEDLGIDWIHLAQDKEKW